MRELSAPGSLDVRQRALTDVANAIAEQGLEMVAWYVRDTIETAVCLASRQSSHWSREDRCRFASAHGAAEAAALALLARHHIAIESLCALCAPFAKPLESEEP